MGTTSYFEPVNIKAVRNNSIDSILTNSSGHNDHPILAHTDHPDCNQSERVISNASQVSNNGNVHQSEANRTMSPGRGKRIRKAESSKESGSRKFLSFFQKGFHSKRPKSIGKMERKKVNVGNLETDEFSEESHRAFEFNPTPSEGLMILRNQLQLPQEWFHRNSLDVRKLNTTCTPIDQSQTLILPVHASMLDRSSMHCFQITSNLPVDMHGIPIESMANQQANAVQIQKLESYVSHIYECPNLLERVRWMHFLRRLIKPNYDAKRRRENCLHIWIQEAKGLVGRHRYHCKILMDGKLYARTTSKQLTDMVFWGEEFDLSGLPDFELLTVELWIDSDKKDPPSPRKPSSQERRHCQQYDMEYPVSNPSQSPFGRTIMACTRGSNNLPEDSRIDAQQEQSGEARIKVKTARRRRRDKSVRNTALIASVQIPANKLGRNRELECWYTAEIHELPDWFKRSDSIVDVKTRVSRRAHVQSAPGIQLRIKSRYRSVCVLPLAAYARLQHTLQGFTSADELGDENSAREDRVDSTLLLSSLDPWLGVKTKAELAGSMVVLQQALGQAPDFISTLILREVNKQADPNMVLRGNSIATKATEIYLRLAGETYLYDILSEFVQHVLQSACTRSFDHWPAKRHAVDESLFDCEVDTSKVENSGQLEKNRRHLLELVQMVWGRIVASQAYFPSQLRELFANIRQHLDALYPNTNKSSPKLSEHVISACLFLRYICPAILSPSLFGLTVEFPSDPKVLRAFTLVAKTIQSLANFSLFSGTKEVYMTFMNHFVSAQLPVMRHFLHGISTPLTPVLNSDSQRMRFSASHHSGLMNGDSNASCLDLANSEADSRSKSCMTRSNSVLPTTTPPRGSPHPCIAFPQPDPLSRCSLREPIPLPDLQSTGIGPQRGDQIDLPLCLALCHLLLSEALASVPEQNAIPLLSRLIPILEEINFFLASGIDPDMNWWSSKKCNDSQNVLTEQNVIAHSTSVASVQTDTSSLTCDNSWKNVVVTTTQTAYRREFSLPDIAGPYKSDGTLRTPDEFPVYTIPTASPNVTRTDESIPEEGSRRHDENIEVLTSQKYETSSQNAIPDEYSSSVALVARYPVERTMESQNLPSVKDSDNHDHVQCNSSGYHSLDVSHRNEGRSVSPTPPYETTFAVTMNNPLYIVHGAKTLSSQDTSSSLRSSPSKQPIKKSPTLSSSLRSKSFSLHECRRRHAYVNITSPERLLTSARDKYSPEDMSHCSSKSQQSILSDGSPTVSRISRHENGRMIINSDPKCSTLEATRPATTLHAVLQAFDDKSTCLGMHSFRSMNHSIDRRTPLNVADLRTSIPTHLRDELDASQARLAEAQARLLANEAERIQLLRAWHSELIRQSQLINQRTTKESIECLPEADRLNDERVTYSAAAAPWSQRDFPNGRTYRTNHRCQPRMGASILGAVEISRNYTLPKHQPTVTPSSAGRPVSKTDSRAATLTRSPSTPGLTDHHETNVGEPEHFTSQTSRSSA